MIVFQFRVLVRLNYRASEASTGRIIIIISPSLPKHVSAVQIYYSPRERERQQHSKTPSPPPPAPAAAAFKILHKDSNTYMHIRAKRKYVDLSYYMLQVIRISLSRLLKRGVQSTDTQNRYVEQISRYIHTCICMSRQVCT